MGIATNVVHSDCYFVSTQPDAFSTGFNKLATYFTAVCTCGVVFSSKLLLIFYRWPFKESSVHCSPSALSSAWLALLCKVLKITGLQFHDQWHLTYAIITTPPPAYCLYYISYRWMIGILCSEECQYFPCSTPAPSLCCVIETTAYCSCITFQFHIPFILL